MCGIVGILEKSNGLAGFDLLSVVDQMNETIFRRGPDSGGLWLSESKRVCLGHRRLAIRDLSPLGHQPMLSQSGRYVIVYNGEIYSTKLILDLLPKSIIESLKGTSDTEIILCGIENFGINKTLELMNGMFAIALYDCIKKELHLIRDRFGKKPLYVHDSEKYISFGSELKAIKVVPGFKSTVDRDALSAFMRHNYIPAPKSIYKNVCKLEPGSLMTIDIDGRSSIRRYWDPLKEIITSKSNKTNGTYESSVNNLENILKDAVSDRLVADVPIGCLLSGGVDSTLVTSLMIEESKSKVKTFSIGFNEEQYNEAKYAKKIAQHLGTEHTELYADVKQCLELISLMPQVYDEPFADSSQLPTLLVSILTKKYITVVLTGDGGDEIFAGYHRYSYADKINSGIKSGARSYLFKNAVNFFAGFPKDMVDGAMSIVPQRFRISNLHHKLQKLNSALSTNSFQDVYIDLVSHWKNPDHVVLHSNEYKGLVWSKEGLDSLENIELMQYLDSITYLPDDILVKVDRASMYVALETRSPFLDPRVFNFAWQLPLQYKAAQNSPKKILKDLLVRYVPRELTERPKMGFGIPLAEWLRGDLQEWAEDLLRPSKLREQGFFNSDIITEYWNKHKSGENWAYPLWNVLMFQSWLSQNSEAH